MHFFHIASVSGILILSACSLQGNLADFDETVDGNFPQEVREFVIKNAGTKGHSVSGYLGYSSSDEDRDGQKMSELVDRIHAACKGKDFLAYRECLLS